MENSAILSRVAHELHVPEAELMRQGLRAYVERELRRVKAEIFQICGRYGIRPGEEMDALYRKGILEEADSWRDFQRLDHLEYKRDRLLQLIEALS